MNEINKETLVFILGAADPEMEAIESHLSQKGFEFHHATAGGERVKPFNANRADGPVIKNGKDVIFVECRVKGIDPVMVVDHHQPGDPGFGRPPEMYWEASSLGQVCNLIEVEKTPELAIVAAADHCLGAAYRGYCPGIDPKHLREWRSTTRTAFQGISREEYDASLEEGMEFVKSLPELITPVGVFKDSRDTDGHRQLPEASAILGVPILYRMEMKDHKLGPDAPVDGVKIGLLNGTPIEIQYFLDTLVRELGLQKPYGDPERGYAGGYEVLPSSMKD